MIIRNILKDYELLNICGAKNYKKMESESKIFLEKDLQKYYHLYQYLDEVELKHAYQASDFIISRAGAGSVFEIAAVGKPSILIPLPSAASDHQSKNAYQYAETGAAFVIEEENLTPNFFVGKLNYLFSRPKKLEEMKKAALSFSKPMAGKVIAIEVLEYLKINE